jgi:hypothetical protein
MSSKKWKKSGYKPQFCGIFWVLRQKLASFCRQTHGFRAGVEFSAENRPESAPRTALGRERGGDFWSLFELQPLERVRTACHQQNTPLRSRQEAWGNGIIMIVTAGNGQARP